MMLFEGKQSSFEVESLYPKASHNLTCVIVSDAYVSIVHVPDWILEIVTEL